MNTCNVHYKGKPINVVSGNIGMFLVRKLINTLCGQYA